MERISGTSSSPAAAASTGAASRKAALKKACDEFESMFVSMMMQEMDKAVPREEGMLGQSSGEEIFRDMLYQETSKNVSSGRGMGISEMLYRQMLEKENIEK